MTTGGCISAVLWLGFHGILRTGELFTILVIHLQLDLDRMVGTIDLPDTKTTFRKGTKESVTLTDDALIMFLAMLVSDRRPGDKLYSNGPAFFRRRFSQLVHALCLQNLYLLPYSLRRGGDTVFSGNWIARSDSRQRTLAKR